MLILLSGIFASMAHVIVGPDHIAAVTPLAIHSKVKSWTIGLAWGIGHVAGMLALGILLLLFRDVLPFESISRHSEFLIGILLVLIGSWALFRIRDTFRITDHTHFHFHEDPYTYAHKHQHVHNHVDEHAHSHNTPVRRRFLMALGIGIVHGLAGFSHLLAILPSLALPSVHDTIIYLTGFSAGTIGTMILLTVPLGLFARHLESSEKRRVLSLFTAAGGLLAITVGIIWLCR